MSGASWDDLKTRSLSAAVQVVIALVAVIFAPYGLLILLWALFFLMHWELGAMFGLNRKHQFAVLGLASLVGLIILIAPDLAYGSFFLAMTLLALPLVPSAVLITRQRALFAAYGVFMVFGITALWYLFHAFGLRGILVLVAIVIASDVAGYFVGKSFGGPKFWPAISPKKTWSGTVGGWAAGFIVGCIAAALFGAWWIIPIAVVLAFGGQMGDIAESAVKRKVGVKDSSDLIPGHGGVLDRFDGLLGAGATAMVLQLLF